MGSIHAKSQLLKKIHEVRGSPLWRRNRTALFFGVLVCDTKFFLFKIKIHTKLKSWNKKFSKKSKFCITSVCETKNDFSHIFLDNLCRLHPQAYGVWQNLRKDVILQIYYLKSHDEKMTHTHIINIIIIIIIRRQETTQRGYGTMSYPSIIIRKISSYRYNRYTLHENKWRI